jgi:hypothetical protein
MGVDMLARRRLNKYLNLALIMYLIIFTFFLLLKQFKTGNYSLEGMRDASIILKGIMVSFMFLGTFIMSIFINIGIIIIFIAVKFGLKMYKKEMVDYKTAGSDFVYYRDKLGCHSPGEISYISDYQIDIKKDVIATILILKTKNKIDFKENRIIILDESTDNLSKNETFVLENIKNNNNLFSQKDVYTKLAIEDAVDNKLMIDKSRASTKLIKQILRLIVVYFILFFSKDLILSLFNCIDYTKIDNVLISIILCILLIALILIIVFMFVYSLFAFITLFTYSTKASSSKYIRTSSGKNLFTKASSLKLFLKNFSSLQNNKLKYINIWDDYLVYSVLFNQNEKVIDYVFKMINNN